MEGGRSEVVVVAEARADLVQLERASEQRGGQLGGQALPQGRAEGLCREGVVTAGTGQPQRLLAELAGPLAVTGERGRPSHAGEGPDVQRIVILERGRAPGLAEHRHGTLTVLGGSPRRVLVTDGGQQPDPGVLVRAQLLVDLSRGREVAGVHVAAGCGGQELDPRGALGDVELRSPLVQRGCFAVGDATDRLLGCQHQVADGLVPVPESPGLDVVVCQLGHEPRVVPTHASLEDPGDAGVPGREVGGCDLVEHRLASQRVDEPVALDIGVGGRDQQPGADREVDPLEDRVGAEVAGLDQESRIDDVAGDRGQLEDPRVGEVEGGQPTRQRVLDRPRRLGSSGADRGETAPGGQVVPVLLEEEGVPSGVVAQHRGGRPGRTERDPGLPDEVLDHVLGGQPDEVDPGDPVETVQVGEGEADRVGAVRGGGTAGGQDEELLAGRGLDQVGQHRQRRFRGPVQVLEDQHRRPLLGRCHEHPQDGVEEDRPGVTIGRRELSGSRARAAARLGSGAGAGPLPGA